MYDSLERPYLDQQSVQQPPSLEPPSQQLLRANADAKPPAIPPTTFRDVYLPEESLAGSVSGAVANVGCRGVVGFVKFPEQMVALLVLTHSTEVPSLTQSHRSCDVSGHSRSDED
jgi:hypothetical protein